MVGGRRLFTHEVVSIFALGYMEGAARRTQKVECSKKFYCLLKGKYTVIITDVTVLLGCWSEAIWIGMKGTGIHHSFARHQLIPFDLSAGCYLLCLRVSHNFVRVEEGDGSRLGLRMLKFVEDIAF